MMSVWHYAVIVAPYHVLSHYTATVAVWNEQKYYTVSNEVQDLFGRCNHNSNEPYHGNISHSILLIVSFQNVDRPSGKLVTKFTSIYWVNLVLDRIWCCPSSRYQLSLNPGKAWYWSAHVPDLSTAKTSAYYQNKYTRFNNVILLDDLTALLLISMKSPFPCT